MAGLGNIQQQAQMQQQGGGATPPEPQMQQDPSGGLGTPPPPKFEYAPNPSSELMRQHTIDQIQQKAEQQSQAALATKAAAERMQAEGGYAGHGNAPSVLAAQQQQQQGLAHPNEGWSPSSPEAHQLNMALAEKIKSGTMDIPTAMSAIQSQEVAPEIKQALASIVNQAQSSQTQQELPSSGTAPQGLGSIPQQQ